jgi:hypothetical protein
MKIVPNEDFLKWAKGHGIVLDARFKPPRTLAFEWEHWSIRIALSTEVDELADDVRAAFVLLPPNSQLWVYNRETSWKFDAPETWPKSEGHVYRALLRALGVKEGPGTLVFSAQEHDVVQGIAFLHFFGSVSDLFIIPESDTSLYLWISCDQEIFVDCGSPKTVDEVTDRLHRMSIPTIAYRSGGQDEGFDE